MGFHTTEDSRLTIFSSTTGTVTLTGDDLSIEDVVRVARRGARVEVSPCGPGSRQAGAGRG